MTGRRTMDITKANDNTHIVTIGNTTVGIVVRTDSNWHPIAMIGEREYEIAGHRIPTVKAAANVILAWHQARR